MGTDCGVPSMSLTGEAVGYHLCHSQEKQSLL